MGTPKSRERRVRGALVGVSSAVSTVGAHAAAGGGVPRGSALLIGLLMCATVGALLACVRLQGRYAGWAAVTGALGAAQMSGHLILVAAGHQHHGGVDPGLSAGMLAAHAVTAVLLGGAIAAAEYLYVVCSSVLCWLRLFALRALRPAVRAVRTIANIVVVEPVYPTGIGMRAPPGLIPAA